MEQLDFDKPLQTQDGRPVRLICRDKDSAFGYTNVGLARNDDGDECVGVFDNDGNHAGGRVVNVC